jgi:hypothetical protein
MKNALSLLTLDWLIPRVFMGVLAGYILRVLEHVIWASKAPPEQNPLGNFRFSMMILPQCIVVGLAIGYLLLALVALYFNNLTVVEISGYLLPGLMSFLAVDLRELLRRISRI